MFHHLFFWPRPFGSLECPVKLVAYTWGHNYKWLFIRCDGGINKLLHNGPKGKYFRLCSLHKVSEGVCVRTYIYLQLFTIYIFYNP